MSVKKILEQTNHRPWILPKEDWKFYQEWNNAIFLHWKVTLNELQKFVPKQLEIDLFEGEPWVSLVAFSMEKIRPKHLPYFPPISNFYEINIRTYIKSKEKTGVYFLSIEGGKRLSCFIAKKLSELPYRYSNMTRSEQIYTSMNNAYSDRFHIKFNIEDNVKHKSDLENWLTERYALFQDANNTINTYEIHHPEWSLRSLKIKDLTVDYPRFQNLLKNQPDKIGYSEGVKVIAWEKQKSKLEDYKTYN
ncbi:YqjF family protein [Aquimarina sp. 2201CG14-23]|uniref:YqjF family protein n=1 Tax=Aquimarina mycalae TaxID=3040073 RepID=UPI002477D3D8|nr:DUF2071 domain-containing protein [Aquimarina sp. 2201CG14-23]MDH7445825.1 DUF2071 domain-containing protein [Aquimarina sp. 2201CG14-23]